MKKYIILIVLLIIVVTGCRKKKWKCDEDVSFANDVQPLLSKHCVSCHYNYDTYAISQSLALSGSLTKSVINTSRMPKEGHLTLKERKKIFCWIEAGAPNN